MNKKVAIFPGHWGKDPGAIDKLQKHEDDNLFSIESVINAAVSTRIQERLWREGINTKLFTGSLPHRIKRARLWKPDVSVSIHCDSFPDPRASGSTVFYWRNTKVSHVLAELLEKSLREYVSSIPTRGAKPADFYILRRAPGPIVLIECGFLSNPAEEKCLNLDSYQSLIASVIINCIKKYLDI